MKNLIIAAGFLVALPLASASAQTVIVTPEPAPPPAVIVSPPPPPPPPSTVIVAPPPQPVERCETITKRDDKIIGGSTSTHRECVTTQ